MTNVKLNKISLDNITWFCQLQYKEIPDTIPEQLGYVVSKEYGLINTPASLSYAKQLQDVYKINLHLSKESGYIVTPADIFCVNVKIDELADTKTLESFVDYIKTNQQFLIDYSFDTSSIEAIEDFTIKTHLTQNGGKLISDADYSRFKTIFVDISQTKFLTPENTFPTAINFSHFVQTGYIQFRMFRSSKDPIKLGNCIRLIYHTLLAWSTNSENLITYVNSPDCSFFEENSFPTMVWDNDLYLKYNK